jgi:hypothetical protein
MVAAKQTRCSSPTMSNAAIPARNMAELLYDLGLVLRWRMRHATRTKRALLFLESLRWDSQLALRFVNISVSVQLRAMVEDWPLYRICGSIRLARETLPRDPS